jgi:hypothetical protein
VLGAYFVLHPQSRALTLVTEIPRVSLEIAGPPIRQGSAGSQPVSAPSAVEGP